LCLGIPAKVLRVWSEGGLRYAEVSLGGGSTTVLAPIEGLRPGDYVIVHAGVAISRLREDEVEETLKLWREVAEALAGPGTPP